MTEKTKNKPFGSIKVLFSSLLLKYRGTLGAVDRGSSCPIANYTPLVMN